MKKSFEYLVIGAGLTGCCIALELSKNGKKVTLIDQDPTPMNRASLRNEGKIHLGLIYAADPKGITGKLQLSGALNFYPLLQSWIAEDISQIEVSSPFIYLVAKDSLLTPQQLQFHYESLEVEYRKLIQKNPNLNYLGSELGWLAKKISLNQFVNKFNVNNFKAAFTTNERAINTDDLAKLISKSILSNAKINFLPNAKVESISDSKGLYSITAKLNTRNEYLEIDAVTVFNSSWDQRLKLDSMVGLSNSKNWVHRLKYRVVAEFSNDIKNLPSATIVLGPYGDVVVRNKSVYLSWYPSGMVGWSHNLVPPAEWNLPCSTYVTDKKSLEVGREIIRQSLDWYPGLRTLDIQSFEVDAGSIFAYGVSDVDQIGSELHDRTNVGVRRLNNFFSVDPGKLTTAPMFALEAVSASLNS